MVIHWTIAAVRTWRGLALLTSLLVFDSFAHAMTSRSRMIEPPMRSSYWRNGLPEAPVNYHDEHLNCGGFEYQWKQANGECGACGDKMNGLRENGYPGKFSGFPPQRSYKSGKEINVTIHTSANLLGYFLFRQCPSRDGPHLHDLAACFKSHTPLMISKTGNTRFYPGSRAGYNDLHLVIPENVSCTHCLLQWTHVTGYREGPNGAQCEPCLGCGPQEHFVNCADIQILPDGWTDSESARVKPWSNQSAFSETEKFVATTAHPTSLQSSSTQPPPVISTPPVTVSLSGNRPSPGPAPCTPLADSVMCDALGLQRLIPGMDTWCLKTCQSGHCRADFCSCFCQYPGYRIHIEVDDFNSAAKIHTPSASVSLPSSSSSSSSASSITLCYKCYKTTSIWRKTPGLDSWCVYNCPSE